MQLGRYELIHRLGAGGMAEVYLARKRGPVQFEKIVVVKKIHPHLAQQDEFIKLFLREARISALLKHPRIVDMYDLGQVDKTYFIAMEYLAGQTLARVIPVGVRTRNPIAPLDAARIIADAADGLHAAHTLKDMEGSPKPVVHRDVSPGNIMVLYNGGVKLLDFGIAKARGEVTAVGGPVLKGKTGYVSPEQIVGDTLDPRSDIFSLGIVLWETIAGRRLFREPDDMATLDAIRNRDVRRPSSLRADVPKGIDDICLRALERDPDKRFQSARDMRIEIENLLWTENYNREDDSIAQFMNDLFADEILEQQALMRRALTPPSDEDGEEILFIDEDQADEPVAQNKPAGKRGRLPLPAPRKTGEVPVLGEGTKPPRKDNTPPPLPGKRKPTNTPDSRTNKPGLGAGVLGAAAVKSVAAVAGAATVASATAAVPGASRRPAAPAGKTRAKSAPGTAKPNAPAAANAERTPIPSLDTASRATAAKQAADSEANTLGDAKTASAAAGPVTPVTAQARLPVVLPLPVPVEPPSPPAAPSAQATLETVAAAPQPAPPPQQAIPAPVMSPTPGASMGRPEPQPAPGSGGGFDAARRKRMMLIGAGGGALLLIIILVVSLGGGGPPKAATGEREDKRAPVAAASENKAGDVSAASADKSAGTNTADGVVRTDGARKNGSDTTTKDGSDTTTKDGSDTATKDGSDTTTKDGNDIATKDGSDTATKPPAPATNDNPPARPKRDPKAAVALFRKGARAFALRQFFEAKQSFKAAIKADPGYAQPYRGLGLLYEKQNRKGDAVFYLRRYLRRAPNAADAANIERIIKRLGG